MQVKHPFSSESIEFSHQAIDWICTGVILEAYDRTASRKIPEYSSKYLADTSRNILKMYVEPIGDPPRSNVDDEPQALISDNFMPSTVGLAAPQVIETEKGQEKEQISRNSMRKRYASTISPNQMKEGEADKNAKKKQHTKPSSDQVIALEGIQNEEEDRIVKFMREKKLADDKETRALQESNKKQTQQKKEPRQKKPIPVTYDFNGEIIRIKNMQATNLVKGGLQPTVDANIQLNSFRVTTQKETVNISNAAGKGAKQPKKKKWAEASEKSESEEEHQAPLTDLPIQTFDLPEGARITTLNRTNEKSKRQLNSRELMDSYKNIKLSRSQYQKIRSIQQNNQAAVEDNANVSIDKKLQQTATDPKSKRRSISTINFKPSNEKMIVSNEELKQTYLHQAVEEERPSTLLITQPLRTTQPERDQQVQFLLRKQPPLTQGLNRTKTLLVLPEIKHKLASTTLVAHKARERVKNEKELLAEIHRKFEDRLRVPDSRT